MKDNTYKTLLLTVLVIIFLILLHFLPKIEVSGVELRNINILSDLSVKSETLKDVIPKPKLPNGIIVRDKDGNIVNFKEVWPKGTERILDFSQGKACGMDHFYERLTSLANKEAQPRPVRIAYFGDSFIEGDIMIADLREMLQQKYGGYGVGWIDAGNDLNQYKHVVHNEFSGLIEHMPKRPDSYNVAEAGIAERYYTMDGTAEIKLSPFELHEYPHTEKWDATRLYLRAKRGTNVSFTLAGGRQTNVQVAPSPKVQMVEMKGNTNGATIRISGSPTLFGTAQESDAGVVVDNFSMRGSDGRSLANLPPALLKEFAHARPYDLIVFQFGVNAVDEKTTPERLKKYISEMNKVLTLFRQCFPETSILVMGSPDRGSKTSPDGTMKGIEMLVGYQEQLASDAKVGFYNLFRSMGGPGTMVRIVDEQEMGTKDYVHINYKGGKYVAGGIFRSIVAGQQNYARRIKIYE